jgi:hypothetical protein
MTMVGALDGLGVLRELQRLLGQRVTVMIAPASPTGRSPLLASFSGELHRGDAQGEDVVLVVGGRADRGFGQIVLNPETLKRATSTPDGLVLTVGAIDVVIASGRFTALLEEQ